MNNANEIIMKDSLVVYWENLSILYLVQLSKFIIIFTSLVNWV